MSKDTDRMNVILETVELLADDVWEFFDCEYERDRDVKEQGHLMEFRSYQKCKLEEHIHMIKLIKDLATTSKVEYSI